MNAVPPIACRVCGTENRPTRLFCSNCGGYLQAEGEDTWEELPPRTASPRVHRPFEPEPVAHAALDERQGRGAGRSRAVGVVLLLLLLAVAAGLGALVYATLFSHGDADGGGGVATSTTTSASTSTTTGGSAGPTTTLEGSGTTLAKGQSISPASIDVSSVLPVENSLTYEPANLFDGLLETAWQEGADGSGEGEWVQFDFDREITLSAMEIANGYQKDTARFSGNPRVETLRVEYSDGTTQQVRLYDDTGFQEIALASKPTEWLRLTILAVYPGDQWDDAGFSEVRLFEAR